MRGIVTGAASGIGREVARRLAARPGARLLLVDLAAEPLERTIADLASSGAELVPFVGDLAQPESTEAVIAAAAPFGALDALVSNAGVLRFGSLKELSLADWDLSFAVNVRATWLLAKAAHPLLKAGRGALVATASISAEEPTPPMGAYSASKAALVMLVKQLAYEWGPDGIRCNCVSPGPTHTGMTDAVYSQAAERARRAAALPLRRIGAPEDLANAILFLLGPEAGFITGVNLLVDGGMHTVLMPAARGTG